MAEARRKAPHSTSVIQEWVGDYAREEGVAASRLQRWIWFMIVLAVLDRGLLTLLPSAPARGQTPPNAAESRDIGPVKASCTQGDAVYIVEDGLD